MPTGLQVKNDDGDICIDEEYRNFTRKASGTATTGTTSIGGTAGIYKAEISISSCNRPMIAVRSTVYVSVIGTEISGSTYKWIVASNTQSHTFDYWVFDAAETISGDNFGFEVFNSSGEVVFHSGAKAMRIVTAYDAGTGGTTGNALTSGRTYAVIQGATGFRSRNFYRALPNNYRYISYCAGHKFDGVTLYIPWPTINLVMPTGAPLQVDDIAPSGTTVDVTYTPSTPKFIVIDVTNF